MKTLYKYLGLVSATLFVFLTIGLAQQDQAERLDAPVKAKPSADVKAKAMSPTPPANAQKKGTIGAPPLQVNTAQGAQDTDSYWEEEIDIDGDGDEEEADLLWDDENKVLYLSDDGPFACRVGGTGNGQMLMAVYGTGNTQNRPAGSGWVVAHLDANECQAQAEGLFGCRFDANGNATECGAAVLRGDQLTITQATKGGPAPAKGTPAPAKGTPDPAKKQ